MVILLWIQTLVQRCWVRDANLGRGRLSQAELPCVDTGFLTHIECCYVHLEAILSFVI